MTNETMRRILVLYERAKQDPEYMALHNEYEPAQTAFANMLQRLPEDEYQIIDNYLRTSIDLYYRLMELALTDIG